MVSPTDILGAISDDRSLLLFNAIALSNSESSDILATRLNLTRKQYYSRMSELVRTNLVNRRNGKYFLTSLASHINQLVKSVDLIPYTFFFSFLLNSYDIDDDWFLDLDMLCFSATNLIASSTTVALVSSSNFIE